MKGYKYSTNKSNDFFNNCIKETLRHEGGIVNNKNDIGKLTYKGISQFYNKNWDGWNIIEDVIKGKDLSDKFIRKEVNEILEKNSKLQKSLIKLYYNIFWKKNCDKIKYYNISNILFDFGVNAGPGRAAKYLQNIINTVADGDFGPNSLKKLDEYILENGEMNLIIKYSIIRIHFYMERVDLKPRQRKFLYGWCERTINLFDKFYNIDNMDDNYKIIFKKYQPEIFDSYDKLLNVYEILKNISNKTKGYYHLKQNLNDELAKIFK